MRKLVVLLLLLVYPWWIKTDLDSRGATFEFGAPCSHRGYEVWLDVTTGCEPGVPWVWEQVLDYSQDTGFGYTTIFIPWGELPVSRIPACGECVRVGYSCNPYPDTIRQGYSKKVVQCLVFLPLIGR